MKRIAFDLDETLVNILPLFEKYLMKMYSAVPVRNDKFKIETNPPLSNRKIWSVFDKVFEHPEEVIIPIGTSSVLSMYYVQTGDPVHIVTARPTRWATETHQLVERFCTAPHTITFVDSWADKTKFLHNYDIFVEDRRRTAYVLADAGKCVYLLDRPYNQGAEKAGIVRIKTLTDLIPVIARL